MYARRRLSVTFANLAVLALLLLVSMPASAFNESLTFRRSANGSFQAVVSGLSDGPSCETEFVPPSDVQIAAATITITSPYESYACSIPQTATPYQVMADLGPLSGASYEVTWTEGELQLTGVLVPAALGTVFGAPTLTSWSLAALVMLLAAFALHRSRRKLIRQRR